VYVQDVRDRGPGWVEKALKERGKGVDEENDRARQPFP
jgi:hypothetical protein